MCSVNGQNALCMASRHRDTHEEPKRGRVSGGICMEWREMGFKMKMKTRSARVAAYFFLSIFGLLEKDVVVKENCDKSNLIADQQCIVSYYLLGGQFSVSN